jgi:RNA polymerase sigma-70 factor
MNETLFVATEGQPKKIGQYTGDGPLTGFVSTSARRTAMRMVASASRFQGEDALARQFSAVHDQEVAMLKARYGDLFNGAISLALRKLAPRDRLILRLNLIERISTTKLATTYNVSQPTVSRWIQRAADQIFSTVKEMLCEELKIDTSELHSLLALVRSQIDFTLSRCGTDDDPGGRCP